MLGSVIPSSPFLVNDVLTQIDWQRAQVLVEYGPGVGTITQEILKRMGPDALLVAIELNPEFVSFLREKIAIARFYAGQLLPQAAALLPAVTAGAGRQVEWIGRRRGPREWHRNCFTFSQARRERSGTGSGEPGFRR